MAADEQVCVEVTLTPGDIYIPYLWSWPNILRGCVALFLIIAAYNTCLRPDAPVQSLPDGSAIAGVLVAVVLLIVLGLTLFPYLRLRGSMKKFPAIRGSRRYNISAEGIELKSEFADAHIKWPAFVRILETRTTFFFQQTRHAAIYLPKRCFHSQEEIVRLRKLIIENYKGKWRLRRE